MSFILKYLLNKYCRMRSWVALKGCASFMHGVYVQRFVIKRTSVGW